MHTDKNTNKDIHTHTHIAYSNFDIPIFAKLYEFYNLLTHAISSFPKIKRYTLGQELDKQALICLESLLSIPAQEDKLITLQALSIKIDLIKILLRLSKDNQCLREKDYLSLQTKLAEIGRMLGGWIRASKNPMKERLSEKPTSSSD